MEFLGLIPSDTFIENLEISAFIFNQGEVKLSEISCKFKIERIRLKNKIKEMIQLKLIKIEKIATKNDIKITSTYNLGVLFEAFLGQINSEKPYELNRNNKDKRKRFRGDKYDSVILRATTKLADFLETMHFLVRSTEKELKKRGYLQTMRKFFLLNKFLHFNYFYGKLRYKYSNSIIILR